MLKKLLFLSLLLTSFVIFSQIPSYYNDVNLNLQGSALKDELATKIISTHHTFISYTPGVWDALKQTDLDPNNPNNVKLIYGWDDTDADITNDYTRDKETHGGTTGDWNREHVYAKSLANPNLGTSGAGADAHNLRPADFQRNSTRNNRKFANGNGTPSYITPDGYWYPGDEWKGDVARMIMYMYLRYGSQCLPNGVGVGNTIPTDPDMIDLFLQWNAEDPVSDLEKQRNPVLEGVQGNRNPFIDNPAFATQIWGGPLAEDLFGTGSGNNDTQAPTAPTNLTASNITQYSVDLNWDASIDNTAVAGYNIYNGSTQIGNSYTTSFYVDGLIAGASYSFTVVAYDYNGNVSVMSNTVAVTTISSGAGNGNTTDLLISEYVEGSSYNKAIEIANFTGAAVDLSIYSLKKVTNGGGTWTNTLNLSGTIINGDVYVISHGSATQEILNVADLTDGGVLSFNGNDAVGLFKNDVLIDLIGDPNSTANFAQDVTLQRKTNISSPNTAYNESEWNILASDTFTDLGTHSIDGGTTVVDNTAPTTPSNLIASNITETTVSLTWDASTDDTAVTGYDIYQDYVKVATTSSVNFEAINLIADSIYDFYVIAFDEAGNYSQESNIITVTTLPVLDTEAPSTPTNLAVANVTETSADLSWDASFDNIGVTAYDVYQDNIKIASTTTTNYNATNLIESTNYTFYIVAKDEAGNESQSSNVLGVTTKSISINPSTILVQSYFETGWDNWTDGGSDCAYYSGSRSWEGSSSIQLRDNSGVASSMTSETIDLTPYETVEFDFYFYPYSMETGEEFMIRYFNGNTWETIASYVSGTDFENSNFYNATITLSNADFNFVNNSQFRIEANASNNSDYVYIDQVTITGNTTVTAARGSSVANTITHLRYLNTDEFNTFEGDFKMYPNPVKGNVLNIKLHNDVEKVSYKIISLVGQVIKEGMIDDDIIQLENINTGVYMLEINDGNEIMVQKFIKK